MNSLPPSTQDLGFPDILQAFSRKKWFLLGSALLFACISLGYALYAGPTYKATAIAAVTTPVDLNSYNVGVQTAGQALDEIMLTSDPKSDWVQMTPLKDLAPKEAYAIFLRHLNSTHNRVQFFEEFYLPANGLDAANLSIAERDAHWTRFMQSLLIAMPHKDTPDAPVLLNLKDKDASRAASLLNQYVVLALTTSQQELQQTLRHDVQSRIHVIDQQIQAMRATAATNQQARIVQLRDALELASRINLEQPAQQGNIITSFTGDTMYLRGSRALEAELRQVQARQDNDPYIERLDSVMRRRNLLETIDTRAIELQAATIDQPAMVPQFPITPTYQFALWGALAGLLAAAATTVVGIYLRQARN